jgi:hypothetical protein
MKISFPVFHIYKGAFAIIQVTGLITRVKHPDKKNRPNDHIATGINCMKSRLTRFVKKLHTEHLSVRSSVYD